MKLSTFFTLAIALIFRVSAFAAHDSRLTPNPNISTDSSCKEHEAVSLEFIKARVIFFGEVHGTEEAPRIVGCVVSTMLAQGHHVLLGLEIPSNEQPLIEAYIHGDGTKKEYEKLLSGSFWTSSNKDGRSSEAVFNLIETARLFFKATGRLRVVVFAPYKLEKNFDESMATNVIAAMKAESDEKVIVLAGNYHSRRSLGSPWDPDFKPMAYYFNKFDTASINIENRRGSAWNCLTVCGEQVLVDMTNKIKLPLGLTVLNGVVDGYDAVYWLDKVNTSFPASLR